MIHIAICEDDVSAQKMLHDRLDKTGLLAGVKYYFFENGKDLLKAYADGMRYDIVFLDIDMPFISGIDVGNKIAEISSRAIIIFVTSYPQFAIDAFDCNAFNYLLKDSDDDKFNSVIYKAVEKYKSDHKAIVIHTKDGNIKLKVSDIYYVECCSKHLYYHTAYTKYITKKTLTEAYEELQPLGFYQIHQGYIVNLEKVRSIYGNDMILINKQKVMISVRKRKDVVKTYSEYIRRHM